MRLPAVICWFTFLFAVIATVVTHAARSRMARNPYPAHANDSVSTEHDVVSEKEKARVAQQDA